MPFFESLIEQRPWLLVLALALLWFLESHRPRIQRRERRLSHALANLGLAVCNGALSFGVAFALLAVTQLAQDYQFGLLPLLNLPPWASWITALVILDCWQYWWHRLNHRLPLLWRFHAVHHADAELDVTSGLRFHTMEILFSHLARLLVLPLLGLTLPQVLLYETLVLPIILFHHSNLRLPPRLESALRLLIITPGLHVLHHSRYQPETDSNFASGLSVWDRLFGTQRSRPDLDNVQLGLDDWEPKQWRSFVGMLTAPFRRK